ncbi:hypothetical protein BDW75DRAFT_246161 [Aspergillus navahoensis]
MALVYQFASILLQWRTAPSAWQSQTPTSSSTARATRPIQAQYSLFLSPATSTVASSLPASCRPEIKIKLARLVSHRRLRLATPGKGNSGKALPWRRTTAQVEPLPSQIPNAQSQTLVECNIWPTPDVRGRDVHEQKFNFSLPIPGNIPPTTDTVLGSVSYIMTAAVRLALSVSIQDLHPIRIRRVASPVPILHLRTYPGSPVVTELCIAPHPSDTKRAGKKQNIASTGGRESEVKYVVATAVRWRVDKTVKRLSLVRHVNGPNGQKVICNQQYTRQLCQGEIAGRWMADSGCTTQTPRQGNARNHVSHQLRVEVVTGEYTFHRKTGDLVERRTCVKSYKAVFALPVRDAAKIDLLSQLRAAAGLPKYDDPYPALPDYCGC